MLWTRINKHYALVLWLVSFAVFMCTMCAQSKQLDFVSEPNYLLINVYEFSLCWWGGYHKYLCRPGAQ